MREGHLLVFGNNINLPGTIGNSWQTYLLLFVGREEIIEQCFKPFQNSFGNRLSKSSNFFHNLHSGIKRR